MAPVKIIRLTSFKEFNDNAEEDDGQAKRVRARFKLSRVEERHQAFRMNSMNLSERTLLDAKCPRSRPLSVASLKSSHLIILICIVISSSSQIIISSNCDHYLVRSLPRPPPPLASSVWPREGELDELPQPVESSVANLKDEVEDHLRHGSRKLATTNEGRQRGTRSTSVVEVAGVGPDSSPKPAEGRPNNFKVAALATKLNQWLKCYRANLLSKQQREQRQSEQLQGNRRVQGDDQSGAGATTAAHEPEQAATCPAHFDKHLCWPETKIGQQIRLACPQINLLLAPDLGAVNSLGSATATSITTNHHHHHQQQPFKTVIANIQRQQDSLNGGDINQTLEITSANIQSIKPTGSRLGIATTTINQSNSAAAAAAAAVAEAAASNSLAYDDDERAISQPDDGTSTSATTSRAETGASGKLITGSVRQVKFARRTCERADSQKDADDQGQWQSQADYSDCKPATGSWFDPTDEWFALNDDDQEKNEGAEDLDRELFENLTAQLKLVEASIDPYSEPEWLEHWIFCISEVMRHQALESQRAKSKSTANNSTGHCPVIFDGWRCWPATPAGEIAYVNCPKNQLGFSAENKAYKICTLQADWYRHPETNNYWSNYTTCVDTVDLAFRTKILNLYVIGNLISAIALAVSLIIFVAFKSLNCTRVTIHKNLFLSFITNNLMWIVWYTYVVNDANLLQSNPIGCRLWHILLHYFLVSNYFWMFCEGLYLHTLLVVTFISEDKILKWFYLLGWLTPVPIVIAYAYNRSYDEYYTNFCWMEESPHNVILMAPIGVSLLLNLIFLINIVRVLVTKLRANNSSDTHQTRKAVRATLILIPLLGLHYMLTPFRPEAKSEWEAYYETITAVCTSFQGLCVAMLFCFYNGEVMNAIKKRLKDSILFNHDSKRTMRSRSNTAVSNVFHSVAIATTNHNGNGIGTNHGSAPTRISAVSSLSSSSCGNLINNQLQRQQLIGDNNKQTPNGCHRHIQNQLTEVALSQKQASMPLASQTIIETKLLMSKQQATPETFAEEAVKLLAANENNNNNIGSSVLAGQAGEASC